MINIQKRREFIERKIGMNVNINGRPIIQAPSLAIVKGRDSNGDPYGECVSTYPDGSIEYENSGKCWKLSVKYDIDGSLLRIETFGGFWNNVAFVRAISAGKKYDCSNRSQIIGTITSKLSDDKKFTIYTAEFAPSILKGRPNMRKHCQPLPTPSDTSYPICNAAYSVLKKRFGLVK